MAVKQRRMTPGSPTQLLRPVVFAKIEVTNSAKKTTDMICAIVAAVPAIPVNPRRPATNERIRKMNVQWSMA